MQQKLTKLDRISVMNNLVYTFYESDHVLDFFPTLTHVILNHFKKSLPHYIAFTSVFCFDMSGPLKR